MVYTYTTPADTAFDMAALAAYDLWIADYWCKRLARRHGMWQYTSSGKIPGVSGPVDLSLAFYKDYAAIIQRKGAGQSERRMTMKNEICAAIGIVGGAIASLLGGWDTALQTLHHLYGDRLHHRPDRGGGVPHQSQDQNWHP